MDQPKVGDELRKMPVEPLLPVEKKLIAWSLGLGVVLLAVLIALTRAFPVAAGWAATRASRPTRGSRGRSLPFPRVGTPRTPRAKPRRAPRCRRSRAPA